MVRDRVATLTDSLERSRRQFREHGELPHAVDRFHEVPAVLPMNDSAQMNMHSCGTFSYRRNLCLLPGSERYARGLDRADQAAWRSERTDLRSEFDQSLIRQSRLGFPHCARRGFPQGLRILIGPTVQARKHTPHISIDDRVWLIEGDAENRARHVLADPGKFQKGFVIGGYVSTVLLHNLTCGRHQVSCTAVVAEAGPDREHTLCVVFSGSRQSFD